MSLFYHLSVNKVDFILKNYNAICAKVKYLPRDALLRKRRLQIVQQGANVLQLVFISRQTGATEHQILDVRAGQRTSETSDFSTGQRLD